MLLLIIASAETLIDKSLQGLQARLNDRLYKKQGHGGHWKTSVLIALNLSFFGFHYEHLTGHAVVWWQRLCVYCCMCSMYVSNDWMN